MRLTVRQFFLIVLAVVLGILLASMLLDWWPWL
jgi:hypothetical protein